jgi:hypothetical protein
MKLRLLTGRGPTEMIAIFCPSPLSSEFGTKFNAEARIWPQHMKGRLVRDLESVTLSVGTTIGPCGIAYCRAYGVSLRWTVPFPLCAPSRASGYEAQPQRHAMLSLITQVGPATFRTPHSGLRKDFRSIIDRKSVTLSIGTPLCPYPISYRRAYGLFTSGLFLKNLRRPLCGLGVYPTAQTFPFKTPK